MRRRGLLEEFLADRGHPFLPGDRRPSAADLSFDLTARDRDRFPGQPSQVLDESNDVDNDPGC